MSRTTALVLALGFVAGMFVYGGVWAYGDGFVFNRFTGTVIYVDLPEDEDVAIAHRPREHRIRPLPALHVAR